MIHSIAYPRAALFGNPSDGFFGKTIAFPFRDFRAEVSLSPTESGIRLQGEDQTYSGFDTFYQSMKQVPKKTLLQATLKRFLDYCRTNRTLLSEGSGGFEIKFKSDIPLQVGMAGSSAIITAIWRVLLENFNLELAPHLLANQVLEVETIALGIGAGLQDRVVQAYECPVYMDFDQELMASQGFGHYEPIPAPHFQNLYIAYMDGVPEGSEIIHNDLRSRFDQGEEKVHRVMQDLSALTTLAKNKLANERERRALGPLIDRNFDLRQSICQIAPAYLNLIQMARKAGASAKFTGSGGTIIGQYTSEEAYQRMGEQFSKNNIHIFKPTIVSHS